jgi:AraC-like DNA-binding protein
MDYIRYAVPAILKNYIRYYWSADLLQTGTGGFEVKSFADRYPRLVFQIPEGGEPMRTLMGERLPLCYLSGIKTQERVAAFDGVFSQFGVSFYPHALNAFFKVDATELVNQVEAIESFCKTDICCQLEQARSHHSRVEVLNAYFYEKLFYSNKQNLLINNIMQQNEININCEISELSKKYNISQRQLERLFKTSLGISPKKLQRIIRFEKALELLSNTEYNQLTTISYQLNYTDQSHFIKDFNAFSGITPYQFVAVKKLGAESASFLYSGS